MAFDLSAGALIRSGSGVLTLALGLFFILVKPRRRPNAAFGLFLVGFGFQFAVFNLVGRDAGLAAPTAVAAGLFALVAVAALLYATWTFPRRLEGVGASGLAWAVAAAVVTTVAVMGAALALSPAEAARVGGVPQSAATESYLRLLALRLEWGVEWLFLLILALRFRVATTEDHDARSQAALVSAGLVLYLAFDAGLSVADDSGGYRSYGFGQLLGLTAFVVAWLRNTGRPGSAVARNVALTGVGACLAGIVLVALLGSFRAAGETGGLGIFRSAGAVLIGYAALRHRLLGFDVALPTARRGAVAASSLAALFIVAQVAQNFLSDAYGLLMGGVVAGVLLFAAAPIQRAAEKMVSSAGRPGRTGDAHARDAYRSSVRLALRDGIVNRDEEHDLAAIADSLGLGAQDALAIREEVEREGGPRRPRRRS